MRTLSCLMLAACAAVLAAPASGQPRRPAPPTKSPTPGEGWDPARDSYKDLLEKTKAAVTKLNAGRTRVAVFTFGDAKGGLPESERPELLKLTTHFLSGLTREAGDKFSVLGPDAIDNELKSRDRAGADPAGLNPDKPDAVAKWMRDNLPEDVRVAVLGRMTHDKETDPLVPVLTLISRDGKVETVRAGVWFGVPGRDDAGVNPVTGCLVTPTLSLRVVGDARARPLTLYADKKLPHALAVIPDDLLKALDDGKLRLEIELKRTTAQPDEVTVGNEIFDLAKDDTRLTSVAVSIDMRETIADVVRDQKTGQLRSAGYRILPQAEHRKWVLTHAGLVVRADAAERPVVERVTGVGHSVRPILGFQADKATAELFTVRRPSDGSAAAAGISSSPGLIRITTYAEKKKGDKLRPERTTGPAAGIVRGVSILPGEKIEHPVVSLKVDCYPTPLEEHVILLCTTVQHDPEKEKLEPYPPPPVTR